ncbi:hypothetical protein SMICM17S_01952 [Streptomyces microflavus]
MVSRFAEVAGRLGRQVGVDVAQVAEVAQVPDPVPAVQTPEAAEILRGDGAVGGGGGGLAGLRVDDLRRTVGEGRRQLAVVAEGGDGPVRVGHPEAVAQVLRGDAAVRVRGGVGSPLSGSKEVLLPSGKPVVKLVPVELRLAAGRGVEGAARTAVQVAEVAQVLVDRVVGRVRGALRPARAAVELAEVAQVLADRERAARGPLLVLAAGVVHIAEVAEVLRDRVVHVVEARAVPAAGAGAVEVSEVTEALGHRDVLFEVQQVVQVAEVVAATRTVDVAEALLHLLGLLLGLALGLLLLPPLLLAQLVLVLLVLVALLVLLVAQLVLEPLVLLALEALLLAQLVLVLLVLLALLLLLLAELLLEPLVLLCWRRCSSRSSSW